MILNTIVKKKNKNLGIINKIHLNCDCIDGSVLNGARRTILNSFVLDNPRGYKGYKVNCQPETIQNKKINKSVLNTIYLFRR